MLIGRLDWISKLWLVLQLAPSTPWPIRKKIDIRYHELSDLGYHRKLVELVELAPVARPEEVAVARRAPPKHTRASRRGNLIREFSTGDAELEVDWHHATYRVDDQRFRVDF
jgi:proteasome accessory factor A